MTKYKKVHFIGIGGIGVSALAQIYFHKGIKISGSDPVQSEITKQLEKKGDIFYEHNEKNIPEDCDLVVYSPAIPKDNPEYKFAKKNQIELKSYPEALGELTKEYFTVAIAGTHGKSTTTAMTALAATASNLDPTVVIGTKIFEFNNQNFRFGQSNLLIIEACEYKESFLNFHPDIILITNTEPDHLDFFKTAENYYKVFEKFEKKLKPGGKILKSKDLKETNITLKVPGDFNVKNATLALSAIAELTSDTEKAKKALTEFKGTWRRMQHVKTDNSTDFYDDYAHHPTEIKCTLKAFREKYGNNAKILTVFQPHQYSRTHELLNQFAQSFDDTTHVIIPNIYKVRDSKEDIKKVSAKLLSEKIGDKALKIEGFRETAGYINAHKDNYDLIITMGAGDIYKLQELI